MKHPFEYCTINAQHTCTQPYIGLGVHFPRPNRQIGTRHKTDRHIQTNTSVTWLGIIKQCWNYIYQKLVYTGKLFLLYVMHLWNVQWSTRSNIALLMHNRIYTWVYISVSLTAKLFSDIRQMDIGSSLSVKLPGLDYLVFAL